MGVIKNSNLFKEFIENDIATLTRSDLGVRSFQEIQPVLTRIRNMLEEMISIADTNEKVPEEQISAIMSYVQDYATYATGIRNYNMELDARNGFEGHQKLIDSVKSWFTGIFKGNINDGNSYRSYAFLDNYNSLKLLNLEALQNAKAEIDKLTEKATEAFSTVESLIETLRQQASSEAVQDYAAIFEKQAERYSHFKFKKPWHLKIGKAQMWLITAVFLICGFVGFIFNINSAFPIDFSHGNQIAVVEMITRVLIVSFAIYLISFAIKQYNIQNHLYTLNKHRQNTLNSYKLFIVSLDSSDATTKNALLMEVAKAIYESGQSGYIQGKDGEMNPSIIEMTRFVGSK
ncbi:hypothetical protein [Hufsiella ginkgonis]|uniref:Uncharacterized protein n=1 Tax=Hufsiella ginkgonis TaxID=2695274 RepID=A0A7K1Y391_9SPHI|nr:hypothetical protein [Hufsiella ginkgonis]MXV17730.1 hypothetical protein [Hufsiella ginkgonis]